MGILLLILVSAILLVGIPVGVFVSAFGYAEPAWEAVGESRSTWLLLLGGAIVVPFLQVFTWVYLLGLRRALRRSSTGPRAA